MAELNLLQFVNTIREFMGRRDARKFLSDPATQQAFQSFAGIQGLPTSDNVFIEQAKADAANRLMQAQSASLTGQQAGLAGAQTSGLQQEQRFRQADVGAMGGITPETALTKENIAGLRQAREQGAADFQQLGMTPPAYNAQSNRTQAEALAEASQAQGGSQVLETLASFVNQLPFDESGYLQATLEGASRLPGAPGMMANAVLQGMKLREEKDKAFVDTVMGKGSAAATAQPKTPGEFFGVDVNAGLEAMRTRARRYAPEEINPAPGRGTYAPSFSQFRSTLPNKIETIGDIQSLQTVAQRRIQQIDQAAAKKTATPGKVTLQELQQLKQDRANATAWLEQLKAMEKAFQEAIQSIPNPQYRTTY